MQTRRTKSRACTTEVMAWGFLGEILVLWCAASRDENSSSGSRREYLSNSPASELASLEKIDKRRLAVPKRDIQVYRGGNSLYCVAAMATERTKSSRSSKALASASGAVVGFLVLCALAAGHGWPKSVSLLPRMAVERLSLTGVLLLVAMGFCWAFVLKPPYAKIAALSQLALFPVIAVVEMFMDPTSHNLWPLEFMMYAVLTGFGFLGLKLAAVWKYWFSDS